jgi:hypothetical protein
MFNFLKGLLKSKLPTTYPASSVVWSVDAVLKGVVIPSPNNDIFITVRHYGVQPPAKVKLTLDDGSTFETEVVEVINPDIQINKTIPLADKPKNDRYGYGDISICKVAKRFPIVPLKIEPIADGRIHVQHKDKLWKMHTIGYQQNWGRLFDLPNWIRTFWGKNNFTQGDSGLPWFQYNPKTKVWSIVGITSRTSINSTQTPWSGESPKLGSPLIHSTIERYTN